MLVSGNVQLGMNADPKAFFHSRNGDDPSVHKGALAFGRPMVQPLLCVVSCCAVPLKAAAATLRTLGRSCDNGIVVLVNELHSPSSAVLQQPPASSCSMLLAVVLARLGSSCTALPPSGCQCAAHPPLYRYTLILPSPQCGLHLRNPVVPQFVAVLLCLNSMLEARRGGHCLAWVLALRACLAVCVSCICPVNDRVCLSHVATGNHSAFPGWHGLPAHLHTVCKPTLSWKGLRCCCQDRRHAVAQ